MPTARGGHGHRAYMRKAKRLRNEGKDCSWCGKPIDYLLPFTDAMSFTADHPEALANGGHIFKQELAPMHRRCNTLKGKSAAIVIRPAQ